MTLNDNKVIPFPLLLWAEELSIYIDTRRAYLFPVANAKFSETKVNMTLQLKIKRWILVEIENKICFHAARLFSPIVAAALARKLVV